MISVSPGQLGNVIAGLVRDALVNAAPINRLDNVLVAQARRRIDNSGDSEIRYQPLKDIGSERSRDPGAKPLRDTSVHIYDRLGGGVAVTSTHDVRFFLRGPLLAYWHHVGYRTKGPNFSPLTRAAARTHRKGMDPRIEGLVPGVDYFMAWGGVTGPARPIYRVAPEDREEIVDAIVRAVRVALQAA